MLEVAIIYIRYGYNCNGYMLVVSID
jgi:hypothetical protein